MFTRLHHLGLVVDDLEAAKKLWLDTYGFKVDESRSPLPKGRHMDMDDVNILDIPVGESELEITSANAFQTGTERFLARRGPGLHHICFYSDDIDADAKRLSDGGLQAIVQPSGSRDQKGGSRVAFFHPRGNLGFSLEVWQDMPVSGRVPQPHRGRGGHLTKIHHIGVVCATLEEARHLFMDVYGLKLDAVHTPLPNGRYAANDNVRILEFPIGESRIEATVPQDETSGTARFLESRGPGIHHVCFYSDEIEHDANRLKAAGLQQIGAVTVAEGGRAQVAFFHPKSNMGILVELWQDAPAR